MNNYRGVLVDLTGKELDGCALQTNIPPGEYGAAPGRPAHRVYIIICIIYSLSLSQRSAAVPSMKGEHAYEKD